MREWASRAGWVGLIVGALALGATSCGKPVNARIAARSSGAPTNGGIAGQVYTNSYFGLTFPIPSDWVVAPAQQPVGPKSANADTHQLLLISRQPLGTKTESNPTLLIVAEKVSPSSARNGREYVEHISEMLADSIIRDGDKTIPYAKAGKIREFSVGGEDWHRADLTARLGDRTVHQSYISTVIDGYALSFVIAAMSEPEIQELERYVARATLARP